MPSVTRAAESAGCRWNQRGAPCASGTAAFDLVIAASVLEYMTEPTAVLRECARVLRSGGSFCIGCRTCGIRSGGRNGSPGGLGQPCPSSLTASAPDPTWLMALAEVFPWGGDITALTEALRRALGSLGIQKSVSGCADVSPSTASTSPSPASSRLPWRCRSNLLVVAKGLVGS